MYVYYAEGLEAFYDGERTHFGRDLRQAQGQRSNSRITE